MPPGTVSYNRLYRRVGLALDAIQASTYPAGTPTLNDRRRPDESIIRDSIVNKDAAVAQAICMSEKSAHRVRFMSYSGVLIYDVNGAPVIPDHYGPIGQVVIQGYNSGPWLPGVESDTVLQINEWRENVNNVYGAIGHDQQNSPNSGYFKQEGVRLNFTGYAAKVEIPSFDISPPGTNPPTLLSPDAFEDVIMAGAVGDSLMEGDESEIAKHYREYYTQTLPMILQGAVEVAPFVQK